MDEGKFNEASSKCHMVGGDGPNSYAQNSDYQKQLLVSAEDLLHELIDKHLDTEKPPFDALHTLRIADLGCSVGPNTFFAVKNIVAALEKNFEKSSQKNHCNRIPDFHVFFNDHVDNDFNTLFRNLPSSRKYFVAAAPGYFHARLFPKAALHFAHCSTALHWLSRIPKEVTERSSSAWNKGRIHYSGAVKEVKEAYSAQFKEDMEAFLSARADELVAGGLMALVIIGFPDGVSISESSIGVAFDILGSCLQDMSQMGRITEEKAESFNLPFYYPSPSELKALIEANGFFCIEAIATLAAPMRRKPNPQVLTSHFRAVTGALVKEHFGNGIAEELFGRHFEKLQESPILVDDNYWKEANYFIFLKRKT